MPFHLFLINLRVTNDALEGIHILDNIHAFNKQSMLFDF